jgi:ParB family chromosome partitioning protein
MEKKALGKGLSALIPARGQEAQGVVERAERIVYVATGEIKTNKYQPRTAFNKEKLEELVNSIKAKGVVQPVLVRKTAEGYELIAGERRLRAVKSLGIEKIPVIVKEADDQSTLEISLIENIQRDDLNPMDEANAYQRLINDFAFTQEKMSQVLGKDRSTIANTLRLLGLPKKIQDYITANSITAGHGKAILSLPTEMDQLRVCNLVIRRSLSVRETEVLVTKRLGPKRERARVSADSNTVAIEDALRRVFGTRVKILQGKKRGRVQIDYYSKEDLERIIGILLKKT